MNIELTESPQKFESLQRSKTEKVLEKWSSEGEIQKDSIRKAANQYAKLEINNKILKWIIVVVVTFLFVLLGFMIASVVLGVNITKEVTVKNGQLVSSSGSHSVVKTATVKYHNKITLNSPSSVIDSLNSITVTVSDGIYEGILQFDVVSYVFIPGKQLTFYGHTHQADVTPDGSVKLTNLVANKRDEGIPKGGSISGTSTTDGKTSATPISSCEDLAAIKTTGAYEFTKSLVCNNLQLPLLVGQEFKGIVDGKGHRLTVNFVASGKVALFDVISGSVNGLIVDGSLQGTGQCAALAVTALTGSFFSKNAIHSVINCADGIGNVAGGYFANVASGSSTDKVVIEKSVSQAKIVFNSNTAVVGGFYGKSNSDITLVAFDKNAADPTITTTGTQDLFGRFNNNADEQRDTNYIVVEVGKTDEIFTNGYPIERCPNNPDKSNCDSTFCYSCRDTTTRDKAKRSLELRKSPPSTEINPNFPKDVCY